MDETGEKMRSRENGAGSYVYGGDDSDDGMGSSAWPLRMGVEPGLGIAVVATLHQRLGGVVRGLEGLGWWPGGHEGHDTTLEQRSAEIGPCTRM